MKKLLMISTDRMIFQEGSAVRSRQAEYAKGWEEVDIIVLEKIKNKKSKIKDTAQDSIQMETTIAPNCWAYSTASRSKLTYSFDATRLGRFLVEKRGVTHITCQDPFLTGMVGVALKKEFPHIHLEMQVHGDIGSPYFTYSWGNKIRKFLARNYLPKADKVRVVSEKIKTYLVEKLGIATSKIEVRPIVVDTDAIAHAPIIPGADLHRKYPQFEQIVLMASRLEPEKNIGYAIDAWAEVVKKLPRAGLILVGTGSEKSKLISHISRLNLKVILEDWADHATLYSYYKTADAFLSTSLFEGYGMTLVEARAAGCSVISTDVGVAGEIGAEIIPFDNHVNAAEILVAKLKGKGPSPKLNANMMAQN